MLLKELLEKLKHKRVFNYCEREVVGITHNSKEIKDGWIYVALKGKVNGNLFIDEAVERGAGAIIVDNFEGIILSTKLKNLIYVENARQFYPKICNEFFGSPLEKLKVIAVVGTNGKTTTAKLISEMYNYSGINTAYIGTLYIEYNNKRYENKLTTPDPYDFYYFLSDMVKNNVEYVIMEVSAHSIALDKIFGIYFNQIIFTNISHDHLDFFGDMKNYVHNKLRLFSDYNYQNLIVNCDDKYYDLLCEYIDKNSKPKQVFCYGNVNKIKCLTNKNGLLFYNQSEKEYTNFNFRINDSEYLAETKLFGVFNIYNLSACILSCIVAKIPISEVLDNMKKLKAVEGRYNKVLNNGIEYIIDFAHTPDGMENILSNVKKNKSKGKVITVFGCGGDRDVEKREIMGRIADFYSDKIILTNDNPRFEDENEIINHIKKGIPYEKYEIILDRKVAISRAIELAETNSSVLILGKGAENFIDKQGVKTKFNDMDVLNCLISD